MIQGKGNALKTQKGGNKMLKMLFDAVLGKGHGLTIHDMVITVIEGLLFLLALGGFLALAGMILAVR